jgi:hypothetical protein
MQGNNMASLLYLKAEAELAATGEDYSPLQILG